MYETLCALLGVFLSWFFQQWLTEEWVGARLPLAPQRAGPALRDR